VAINGPPIGKRFDEATFENFIVDGNRQAVEACRLVARGESTGVVLFGPVGVGKTHLLVAVARGFEKWKWDQIWKEPPDDGGVYLSQEEMANPTDVQYWPILDLVSALRREINEGFSVVSSQCRECDLLVIDDFGQERATEFVLEELERIIDWRYRNEKPIAVSTNLDLDKIVGKYGNRAISRWTEQCDVVEVKGKDRRPERRGK